MAIASPTSSKLFQFDYYQSQDNPMNDYICWDLSRGEPCPELLNIKNKEYFGKSKLQEIINKAVKVTIHPWSNFDKIKTGEYCDKFIIKKGSPDWSIIVNELINKKIITTKMTDRECTGEDGRTITSINSEKCNIKVDDISSCKENQDILLKAFRGCLRAQ